jgi:hypothetical protein
VYRAARDRAAENNSLSDVQGQSTSIPGVVVSTDDDHSDSASSSRRSANDDAASASRRSYAPGNGVL